MRQIAYGVGSILALALTYVAVSLLLFSPSPVQSAQTYSAPVLKDSFVNHTFFSATTTSATSTTASNRGDRTVRLDGANKATFYFSRGDAGGAGNTGSSKFEVEVSPDGSDWYDFNRLYLTDTSKTATSTVWITAATSTVVASMDLLDNTFHFARCQVAEVTDGEHTCTASIEY